MEYVSQKCAYCVTLESEHSEKQRKTDHKHCSLRDNRQHGAAVQAWCTPYNGLRSKVGHFQHWCSRAIEKPIGRRLCIVTLDVVCCGLCIAVDWVCKRSSKELLILSGIVGTADNTVKQRLFNRTADPSATECPSASRAHVTEVLTCESRDCLIDVSRLSAIEKAMAEGDVADSSH